jgi:hypothetical protein
MTPIWLSLAHTRKGNPSRDDREWSTVLSGVPAPKSVGGGPLRCRRHSHLRGPRGTRPAALLRSCRVDPCAVLWCKAADSDFNEIVVRAEARRLESRPDVEY